MKMTETELIVVKMMKSSVFWSRERCPTEKRRGIECDVPSVMVMQRHTAIMCSRRRSINCAG